MPYGHSFPSLFLLPQLFYLCGKELDILCPTGTKIEFLRLSGLLKVIYDDCRLCRRVQICGYYLLKFFHTIRICNDNVSEFVCAKSQQSCPSWRFLLAIFSKSSGMINGFLPACINCGGLNLILVGLNRGISFIIGVQARPGPIYSRRGTGL